MEKELILSYDKLGDILDIHIGKPKPAISREIEDDFFVRLDPKTGKVVGFSILNFTAWFKDSKGSKSLPIKAKFLLEKE